MTAEVNQFNLNQSPELTAREKSWLAAYVDRVDNYKHAEGITLEQQLTPRSQTVLQRYIENGLNVAKRAPSRVERIAKAMVHEAVTMTPEKAAKIAKNVVATYIKNVNPANFIKEDWYWRGGVGLGVGIGTILTVTGARVNPWIRTSVCLGLSAGFETLANIDYQNAAKKLDKLDLTDEQRTQKLAELDKIKAKAKKISKGMSAGFAYLGFINLAEAAEVSTHFIEEGAKVIDWSKAQIGEVLTPKTAFAAELPIDETVPATETYVAVGPEPAYGLNAETAVKPINYTPEGYKIESISFEKAADNAPVDSFGRDLVSTKGLVEAWYRDGITQKADLGLFDPKNHNIEYLEKIDLEIAADADYDKKIAAATYYWSHELNKEYLVTFPKDKVTGLVGHAFTRTYSDGSTIEFHNLDHDGRSQFFQDGWQKFYSPEVEKLIAEPVKQPEWTSFTFPKDEIYQNLDSKQVADLGFVQHDIDPGNIHSTKGLAEAIVSQQVEGHPNFDPGKHIDVDSALADAQNNPLHDLEVKSVQAQFEYDNPKAVIDQHDLDGISTPSELFYSGDENNQATTVSILNDYGPGAKSLAPLIDEQSLRDGVVSSDFMRTYTLHDLVTDPESLFSSVQAENAVNLRILAEMILAKEFGIDLETLRQKVAEDPSMATKLEKAIAYFKINNNSSLFEGESLKYRSPITGNLYNFRLPNEQALKKLIALF